MFLFLYLISYLCGMFCVLISSKAVDHFSDGEIGWGVFFLLCSVGLFAFAVFVILTV